MALRPFVKCRLEYTSKIVHVKCYFRSGSYFRTFYTFLFVRVLFGFKPGMTRTLEPRHKKTCFCIYEKAKAQINFAVTTQLISVFVSKIPLLPKSEIASL